MLWLPQSVAVGQVAQSLTYLGFIERFTLQGEKPETRRVFELAPEILEEGFQPGSIFVDVEELVVVFLVGRYGLILAFRVNLRDGLNEFLHMVQNQQDLFVQVIFRDLFRGTFTPVRLFCHNLFSVGIIGSRASNINGGFV